ncbi:hypothetical protein AB2Z22_002614 [Clostridium botulinum]
MNKRRSIFIILLLSIFMVGFAPKTVQAYTTKYTKVETQVRTSKDGKLVSSSTTWYKDGKEVFDPTGWYCRIQRQESLGTSIGNSWWSSTYNDSLIEYKTEYLVTIQCKD